MAVNSNECERITSDRFRFYFTFKPQTKALLKVKYPAGLVASILVEQRGAERREGERQGSPAGGRLPLNLATGSPQPQAGEREPAPPTE